MDGTFSIAGPHNLRMPPVTATDANAILAMAKHRMGQTQGAREALERGAKLFDAAWFSTDRVAIRDSVADWLIADILLREAKSVVDGK